MENELVNELYKLPDGRFKIKTTQLKQPMTCPSIELAAEVLELAGVKDEEIDVALISMAKYEHNHASFGTENGTLLFSDVVAVEETKKVE